ncbi:GTPase IMAP family member 9-like [Physella acuta]|uniref:GTPase IMAP family member 9-like n=1 Tax=Physella acuta TaxID=109671 RepID=UPI0027DD71D2|nr:GTPase IMAP family member 9-like [Physella acuta]
MSSKKDLTLLLIGKTGMGKSATGNSLLRREKFDISSNLNSCTKLVERGEKKGKDFTLTIFDTRGLFDADTDKNEDTVTTVKHMEWLMTECPKVDAFLLVLKSGTFSQEDAEVIEQLKTIFGPNFIKDYCYLVLTHGDNYEGTIPFNEYCAKSTGKFKELYNECDKRIFLITNKGGYEQNSPRVTQGENLIAKVQAWRANKNPYTDEKEFEGAALARKQLAFDADKANITKELRKAIDELKEEMTTYENNNTKPSTDFKNKLYLLRNDIKQSDPDPDTKNLQLFLEETNKLIRKADSLPKESSNCTIQ